MGQSSEAAIFGLGKTLGVSTVADGKRYVGQQKEFDDLDMVNKGLRSNRRKLCRLVRNNNASAVTPGLAATFDYSNGLPGCEVSGPSSALDSPVGVVDEWLAAAGAAQYDVFWVTILGPTKVVLTTGSTIAQGDKLVPDANGTWKKQDLSGATSTLGNNIQSMVAIACEAIAASGAGAKILVDLIRR